MQVSSSITLCLKLHQMNNPVIVGSFYILVLQFVGLLLCDFMILTSHLISELSNVQGEAVAVVGKQLRLS